MMEVRLSVPDYLIHRFKCDSDTVLWLELLQLQHAPTYRHCARVALLGEKMAAVMRMETDRALDLIRGCFVHDIGKLRIPAALLDSRDTLTVDQTGLIRLHPQFGVELLRESAAFTADSLGLVLHHHERWDGTGYPDGLAGDDIPLFARICAVVDAFDSMLSDRPYSSGVSAAEAVRELRNCAGTQFDPDIVRSFLGILDEVRTIYIGRRNWADIPGERT